jgi:hypothetical protein
MLLLTFSWPALSLFSCCIINCSVESIIFLFYYPTSDTNVTNTSIYMWVSYRKFYLRCSLQLSTVGECGYTFHRCYRSNTLVSFRYCCTVLRPLFASSSRNTAYMNCHRNSCPLFALSHCPAIYNDYAAVHWSLVVHWPGHFNTTYTQQYRTQHN